MNIIIVGAGEIGSHLINLIAEEGHNIIVIDSQQKAIEAVTDNYDVKGIVGSGASQEILQEANVFNTDILIAVTPSDEINILSCLVAKHNNVKHVIARIRNPEYSNQNQFFHELGLNMIINPELETANKIAELLLFRGALKINNFASEEIELVEIKINKDSPIIGRPLKEIFKQFPTKILICAVERNEKAIIPDGSFILKEGDKVHFTVSVNKLTEVFKQLNLFKSHCKSAMIFGGGKTSFYLAKKLIENNINVKIFEANIHRCEELSYALDNVVIINGSISDESLLKEEGIDKVDALIALENRDEDNIIISLYAKDIVPKVITNLNRISLENILYTFGLETIISPKSIIANKIIHYISLISDDLTTKIQTFYNLINNQVEVSEFYISTKTEFTNKTFKELKIKPNVLVANIIRNKEVLIPNGNDSIKPEDTIIVVSTNKIHNLEDIFN